MRIAFISSIFLFILSGSGSLKLTERKELATTYRDPVSYLIPDPSTSQTILSYHILYSYFRMLVYIVIFGFVSFLCK